MGLKETLSLLITADTSGATKAIEGVGHAADKSLGKTEDRIGAMGKKMTTVGAGMVATGGLLVAAFASAAFASEDAEVSVRKLDNSIENNGKLAADASQDFQDLAKSIQSKTAADADAIVSGQSVLAQFDLTADQIKELTPLAVDLAQKLGIDMDTAFKMVAKSVDGSGGALKKAGIDIDETAFKTDAYGATVEALRTSVGGFAEQEGQTFAGTLARLKNEMGDLQEAVGKGAAEGFQEMLNPVISLTGYLTDLDPKLLNTIGHFGAFGAVGITAAGGLLMTAGQLAKLVPLMQATGDNGEKLDGKMSGLGKAVVGIGIAMGVAALATEAWSQRNGTFTLDITKMADASNELLDGTVTKYAKLLEVAAGGQEKLGRQMAEQSIPQALRYAEALERNGINADEFRKGVDVMKTSLAGASINQEAHSAAIEAEAAMLESTGIPSMKGYEEAVKASEAAQRGMMDAVKAATDPWFAALDAMNQNRDATAAVTEKQLALNQAIATSGAGSVEAAAAQRDLEAAHISAAKSAEGVQAAFLNLQAGVDHGTTSIANAKLVLDGWVSAGLITNETAAVMMEKLTGVGTGMESLDGKTAAMVLTLDSAQAEQKLREFVSRLEGAGLYAAAARERSGLPEYASGGWVNAPQGKPQLAVVHGGEYIVSNEMQRGGGDGGGNTYNYFTINAGMGTDGPAVGRQIIGLLEKATASGVRPGVKTLAAFRS